MKDALFFFLLALRVFCKGSRGIGEQVGELGWLADPKWVWGVKGAGRPHLGPAGTEDPGGRDDHSSVDPQGARLLDLLQHEAGHLAVVLEGGTQLSWAKLSPGTPTQRSTGWPAGAGRAHSPLACTRNN